MSLGSFAGPPHQVRRYCHEMATEIQQILGGFLWTLPFIQVWSRMRISKKPINSQPKQASHTQWGPWSLHLGMRMFMFFQVCRCACHHPVMIFLTSSRNWTVGIRAENHYCSIFDPLRMLPQVTIIGPLRYQRPIHHQSVWVLLWGSIANLRKEHVRTRIRFTLLTQSLPPRGWKMWPTHHDGRRQFWRASCWGKVSPDS